MPEQLKDLKIGETGRVLGFNKGQKNYRKKLLSMGLTPGIEFRVIRFAPMGDPVEITLRGFDLSLRKEEAESLIIEKVS